MHRTTILIIFFSTLNYACSEVSRAKNFDNKTIPIQLILHVDVNKTIIAEDAVQNKEKNEMVNTILAENTYAAWDGTTQESYYNYLARVISQENPTLPRNSDEFKNLRNEKLKGFYTHLIQHHPELASRYNKEKELMLTLLNREGIVIFPSFLRLLAWLEEHYPNNYTIYLRTFGKDLPPIVSLIERESTLRFSGIGHFNRTMLYIDGKPVVAREFLSAAHNKHYAIRDDYTYWKEGDFKSSHGKMFPIDDSDAKRISIFFDDNGADTVRPIIFPCNLAGVQEDMHKLIRKGNIVAVNPKNALLDPDYFINAVKNMINSHA